MRVLIAKDNMIQAFEKVLKNDLKLKLAKERGKSNYAYRDNKSLIVSTKPVAKDPLLSKDTKEAKALKKEIRSKHKTQLEDIKKQLEYAAYDVQKVELIFEDPGEAIIKIKVLNPYIAS